MSQPAGTTRRIAWLSGLAAYVLLLFWLQSHHELWRDEWQAWLLAAGSPTLADLWQHTRHETHPPLWFLLLWVTQRLISRPIAMQVGNALLAAGAVALWLRHAPGSRLQRLLFPAGYYLLYEYGVISRNYALCVALMFGFCHLFVRGRRLGSAVLLALVAVAHPLGLLFSLAWWTGELVAGCRQPRRWAWLSIVALGLLLAGSQLLSRCSYPLHFGAYTSPSAGRLTRVTATMLTAFVPLPATGTGFHHEHTLVAQLLPSPAARALLAILLLLVVAAAVAADRRALIAWLVYVAGFGIFQYVLFGGQSCLRYAGLLYVTALAGWWISHAAARPRPPAARWLLTLLFTVQAVAGLQAARLELAHPFSQAQAVAGFLTATGLATGPILVEPDYAAIPIAGYLDRPVRHLDSGRLATYLIEDYPQHGLNEPQLRQRLRRLPASDFPAVLIRTEPLTPGFPAVFIAAFTPAAIDDEQYYLYRVEPPAPEGPG